jgi:hypothetical protein
MQDSSINLLSFPTSNGNSHLISAFYSFPRLLFSTTYIRKQENNPTEKKKNFMSVLNKSSLSLADSNKWKSLKGESLFGCLSVVVIIFLIFTNRRMLITPRHPLCAPCSPSSLRLLVVVTRPIMNAVMSWYSEHTCPMQRIFSFVIIYLVSIRCYFF